jgi:hypothetical protein
VLALFVVKPAKGVANALMIAAVVRFLAAKRERQAGYIEYPQ